MPFVKVRGAILLETWSFNSHLQLTRNSHLKKIKTICSDFKILKFVEQHSDQFFVSLEATKIFSETEKLAKVSFQINFTFFLN